jgi:hypothetical protein
VELSGFEEIMESKLHSSQTFLTSRIVYQGDRYRPSDAVRGPSCDGYYLANKGKTVFYFAFDIPGDAPASFEFQSLSKLVYQVTGYVRFKYGSTSDTLITSKEARIADRWDIEKEQQLSESVTATNERKLFMGGDGAVQLQSIISSNFVTSGTNISIQVRVKNETKKRIQGIKIAFVRRLMMVCTSSDPAEEGTVKIVDETVSSQSYKDKEFMYDQGEERTSIIHIPIPAKAYTVQKTSLSEIAWRLSVSLTMPGILSKDLTIDLPLRICHPISFDAAPELPCRDTRSDCTQLHSESGPRLSRDMFRELDFGNRLVPFSQPISSSSTTIPQEPLPSTVAKKSLLPAAEIIRPTSPRRFPLKNIQPFQYISAQDRYKNLQEQSILLEEPLSPSQKTSTSLRILPPELTNQQNYGDIRQGLSNERHSRDKRIRESKPKPLPDIPSTTSLDTELVGLGYFLGKAMDLIEYATSPVFQPKEQPPNVVIEEAAEGYRLTQSEMDTEQFVRYKDVMSHGMNREPTRKKRAMRQPKPLPQPKQPPLINQFKKKLNVKTFLDGITS